MSESRPIHGLVLAGGRSTRMGSDKADLVHPDGRPLGRRTIDLLAGAGCDLAVVSLRHDQAMPARIPDCAPVEIIRDPEGGSHGPLSGMIAAMRLHPHADWLVVACDLPRLDVTTLVHLVASRQPGERFLAYRSESDGLPEPLCAFYAAESLPVLEAAAAEGLRCPRKILIRQTTRLLEPVSPGALDNANTPAEWQSATSR